MALQCITAKAEKRQSCLWCFSVMFISSVRRCFLPTRKSCLKNPTQVNPAVCNNQDIHLHFPHFSAYTSLSVSPPFKIRNYREGHKEKRLVYGWRSLVGCSPGSHSWTRLKRLSSGSSSIVSNGFDETHTHRCFLWHLE